MSHTTLAIAGKDGVFKAAQTYSNSWGSAPFIWDALVRKYGFGANFYGTRDAFRPTSSDWPKLWSYHDRGGRLQPWEANALSTTYEHVVVAREDMLCVATSLRRFQDAFWNGKVACSLAAQANDIEAEFRAGALYIAWGQTSVDRSWWYTFDEEADEGHYYNVLTGKSHRRAQVVPLDMGALMMTEPAAEKGFAQSADRDAVLDLIWLWKGDAEKACPDVDRALGLIPGTAKQMVGSAFAARLEAEINDLFSMTDEAVYEAALRAVQQTLHASRLREALYQAQQATRATKEGDTDRG
jgi:hypothetical protein